MPYSKMGHCQPLYRFAVASGRSTADKRRSKRADWEMQDAKQSDSLTDGEDLQPR